MSSSTRQLPYSHGSPTARKDFFTVNPEVSDWAGGGHRTRIQVDSTCEGGQRLCACV